MKDSVCGDCGFEQGGMGHPCLACGSLRVVDIAVVTKIVGDTWRDVFKETRTTVDEAMLAFLLTRCRGSLPQHNRLRVPDNMGKIRLCVTGDGLEHDWNVVRRLATDLGFWDVKENPYHRPPAGVPSRVYSITGAGKGTDHGPEVPPELSRFFASFEEAALAWIAVGKPRLRGSSVWISECEGVDTICTVTIG